MALPLAVSVFLPLTARRFIRELRDAFVLSVVTSLSAVALPFILEAAKKQAEELGAEQGPADEIASTALAVSYPLAQLGNFFIFLFMHFCLYYFRVEVTRLNTWLLLPMTLLSGFGSPSSTVNAIPFLSAWLRVPEAANILWLETMTVTRYGMVVLSVAGFGFITYCSTLHYFGKLRFHKKRALAFLLVTAGFLGLFSWSMSRLEEGSSGLSRTHFKDLSLASELTANLPVSMEKQSPPGPDRDLPPMERIRKSGVLRVGYSTMILPFAYFNKDGDLVGFDVAFAYSLARALGVRLAFVPADLKHLEDDLASDRYDILMSGIAINGQRLRNGVYSDGYYSNRLVLVVPQNKRAGSLTVKRLLQNKDLKLGAVRGSVLWDMTRSIFPNATLVEMKNFDELVSRPELDGMLWAWDQAFAWTDGHPGFSAVRPDGLHGVLLYGWVMPSNTQILDDFVDHWLALKKADGFYETQVQTWFEGRPPKTKQRRWSILQNLLR
ncbi:MAG: ABC transporter substrate-binding protein [Thermodesulfobacteriota bacterium]